MIKDALKVAGAGTAIIVVVGLLFYGLISGINYLDRDQAAKTHAYYERMWVKANAKGEQLCKPHGGLLYIFDRAGFRSYEIDAKCRDGAEFPGLNNMVPR